MGEGNSTGETREGSALTSPHLLATRALLARLCFLRMCDGLGRVQAVARTSYDGMACQRAEVVPDGLGPLRRHTTGLHQDRNPQRAPAAPQDIHQALRRGGEAIRTPMGDLRALPWQPQPGASDQAVYQLCHKLVAVEGQDVRPDRKFGYPF